MANTILLNAYMNLILLEIFNGYGLCHSTCIWSLM